MSAPTDKQAGDATAKAKAYNIEYLGSDGNTYRVRVAFEGGITPSYPDEVEAFFGSHAIVGLSRDSLYRTSSLEARKLYRVYLSAGGGEKGAFAVAEVLDAQGALRSPIVEEDEEEDEDDEEDEEEEGEEEEI
jgi:hypothetical protein